MNDVPEETPEQVMARLARYADTLRRSPGAPIDDASRRAISRAAVGTRTLPPRSALQSLARRPPAPSPAVPPQPAYRSPAMAAAAAAYAPGAPLPYPPSPEPVLFATRPAAPAASRFVFSKPQFTDVRMSLLGQLLAAAACAGAVLAFVMLGTLPASVLVLAGFALGAVAIARHWSLAWWWTLGVLAGGLLGRFS
jgi:hypothetical protein